jgi:amidase
LKGAKIGIPSSFISTTTSNWPEIIAFNESIPILKSLGANIVENANFPGLAEYHNSHNSTIVTSVDFEVDVATYFNELLVNPNNIHSLVDLENFTHTDPREDYPDRDTARWDLALSLDLTQSSSNYTAALAADLYLGSEATILGAINEFKLDALILPTSQAAGVAAIAGYPVVTVPLGY